MLDHIGLAVSDVAKSKSFFQAALAPLGYKVLMDFGQEAVGLGADRPDFWIAKGPIAKSHVAFAAPIARSSKRFTTRRSPPAVRIMERRDFVRSIIPLTMVPLFTIAMATISR